ncbi:MAG: PTS sugar transporter subunit IIC [Eubacterium ventriosum]
MAGLQYVDNYGPQIITDNYMFYAVLVGIVMGDPMTALVVGASIQLMALGVATIGGSSVPNYGMVCSSSYSTYDSYRTGYVSRSCSRYSRQER